MPHFNGTQPGWDARSMYIGIGISFAVRREVMLQGFQLVPGFSEDGDFLIMMQESRRPILISPFVNYFVKCAPELPPYCMEYWSKFQRYLVH